MKSLTPQTLAECSSNYNEPVLLFEVDWSETLTGRYARRAVSIEGVAYAGIIREVGRIGSFFGEPAAECEPVAVRLEPEESLLELVSAAVPEGKPARLLLHFEQLDAADAVELFSGHIERAVLHDDCIELVVEPFFRKYERLLPERLICLADLPKAHPDDVGRPVPLVFGNVPRLPALRVRVGAATSLRGSVLSTDTTIEVDDASGFPSTGTLLIDEEQIAYSGTSGNTFTGCTRGANETDAAEHLNRNEVLEYMTEHVYLVAGHACKAVEDVRVVGVPVDAGGCTINRNNTSLLPGAVLATVTFPNRPKVRRYSRASRFLEMQFDETAAGNEALNPEYCYDTSLEGFPTLVAEISGAAGNDTLRIRQTTDMAMNAERRGEILKAFLMVEHFESKAFTDDYLSVTVAGQTFRLAKPGEEDVAGGGGEVDIDHGHTHSITGEHTHEMTIKKEALFANIVIQTGGSTGGWDELDEIAGSNLNKSGFTTTSDTDRSLLCRVAATTAKGSAQRIQFCCRRGESGMAGSFVLRFYLNGSMQKQYTVSGTSTPETWKSGWETIAGLSWSDLDNENTYITVTPLETGLIRMFGVWYELEYLEQPAGYEGSGTKDSTDVDGYAAANHHVINEEPISSTSVTEGVDITDLVANDWSWFNNREASVDYTVVNSDDGVAGYILHVFFDVEYAPFEEIISDDITCSVQGIETGGDGSGDLIENPADIIEHILVHMLGFDEYAHIDSASFASVRALLAAEGMQFHFSVRDQTKASSLLFSLAEQARCRLTFDGGAYRLLYRPAESGEPVRAVEPVSIFLSSARLEHAGAADIANVLTGHYARDYRKHGSLADRYACTVRAEDTQSRALYGTRPQAVELFALRDGTLAQSLLNFLLASRSTPRRRYRWKSFLRDVDLERGDIVAITDLEKGLLKAKGELVEAVFAPGDPLRPELDGLHFAAALDPYDHYWVGSGGTFIALDAENYYFVFRGELVGRLSVNGNFHIKGFAVADQALPPAAAHPICYDSAREALAFALSDGTRVMELDRRGNLLLSVDAAADQTLSFAGSQDAIECDTQKVWFNIGSTRAAEANSEGWLRLPGDIVEDCPWDVLLG